MRELIRSAFVIGRRDFTATVFSRSFLLFLLGPLFPVLMIVIFGGISTRIASEAAQPVVAVLMSESEFARLNDARGKLAGALIDVPLVKLRRFEPLADRDSVRPLLSNKQDPPVLGVLDGTLADPRFIGAVNAEGTTVRQLRFLIDQARRADAPAEPKGEPLLVTLTKRSAGSLSSARANTARAGQALLFLLTILLAGMLLSQMIEEKSNKVIEILAAAVPIDAIFVGKLFAMLAISLLGIAVWACAVAATIAIFTSNGIGSLPPPAVGWPVFLILVFIYFAMSYLLIGAAFLGIGAQASTVREVQTLSMPVTMAQVVIFAFASAAVGLADHPIGIAAAAFPLSSPFAMIARAAEGSALWPHVIAIAWQALWVALILRIAARLFRRSVLNSGPKRKWWRFWRKATPRSASAT
jgi:ABC-2 type transport system permease protein